MSAQGYQMPFISVKHNIYVNLGNSSKWDNKGILLETIETDSTHLSHNKCGNVTEF